MKKLLLFAVLLLTSCTRYGYVAEIEIHKVNGIVDTISYPYTRSQGSSAILGPFLVVDNNNLRPADYSTPFATGVEYFSVLKIARLDSKD